jgi:hypothetical protein
MGIDFKQIFDFEMTPLMATAVFGSLFVVCAFACALAVKLFLEQQKSRASKKTATSEKNLGDGI